MGTASLVVWHGGQRTKRLGRGASGAQLDSGFRVQDGQLGLVDEVSNDGVVVPILHAEFLVWIAQGVESHLRTLVAVGNALVAEESKVGVSKKSLTPASDSGAWSSRGGTSCSPLPPGCTETSQPSLSRWSSVLACEGSRDLWPRQTFDVEDCLADLKKLSSATRRNHSLS